MLGNIFHHTDEDESGNEGSNQGLLDESVSDEEEDQSEDDIEEEKVKTTNLDGEYYLFII